MGFLTEVTAIYGVRNAGKTTLAKKLLAAHMPPQPSDGKPVFSKNNIPINPTITVIPEKKIARPAVALVMAIAVL